MFDNQVTRFYPGATDSAPTAIFSDIYALDRTSKLIEYLNEFIDYPGPLTAGTQAGYILTGAGSVAQVAGDGGLINLISPVSNFQSMQKTPAFIQLVSGYRSWHKFIGKLDSLLGNTLIGHINVTAAPFTLANITDGIWFTTDVTTGEVKGNVATSGVVQTVDLGVQIIAGQFFQLAYYHDGEAYNLFPNGRVVFEVQTAPNTIATPGVTAPGRAEISPIPAFPTTTLLTPTWGVNASTAAARTLTIDQHYYSKDRTNINATPPF